MLQLFGLIRNPLSIPFVENQHREKFVGVISPAETVFLAHLRDAVVVENSFAIDVIPWQEFVEVSVEFRSHPGTERDIEALFWNAQIFFGYQIGKCLAEYRLAARAVHFEIEGNSECLLDDARIEERNAQFERPRHAHLVRIFQKIIGQEGFDIQI